MASIYDRDLKEIVHFMDGIIEACGETDNTYVHVARIELHSKSDYPIGVIECDVDDNWLFTPYDENTGEGGAEHAHGPHVHEPQPEYTP